MNQTVTIPAKTIDEIFSRLDELTKTVRKISVKLLSEEPTYGSDEWWEWSDKEAMEDIKAGRYTTVHNKKELQQFLDSLKTNSKESRQTIFFSDLKLSPPIFKSYKNGWPKLF